MLLLWSYVSYYYRIISLLCIAQTPENALVHCVHICVTSVLFVTLSGHSYAIYVDSLQHRADRVVTAMAAWTNWEMFSNNMWDQDWFSVYDTLSGLQLWFYRDVRHPPVPLVSTPRSNEDSQTGDKRKNAINWTNIAEADAFIQGTRGHLFNLMSV